MKRKAQFCCDASRDMYEDYYANQIGAAMPAFVGVKRQRGHGLGSMLSSLFRNVLVPFLKRHVGTLAGNVLKTGLRVADDVAHGQSLKETTKKRIFEAIKRTAREIDWQTGSGKPKRKRRRHRRHDIFDYVWRSYTKTHVSV